MSCCGVCLAVVCGAVVGLVGVCLAVVSLSYIWFFKLRYVTV